MIVKQGKTNQEGNLEFTTCLRNKSVNICTQMMLSFYLIHSTLVPLEELCKKVFPRANYWLESLNKEEVLETSTAADGFLNLLVQLHIVLLQNPVINLVWVRIIPFFFTERLFELFQVVPVFSLLFDSLLGIVKVLQLFSMVQLFNINIFCILC
jgi:hypothetical protein